MLSFVIDSMFQTQPTRIQKNRTIVMFENTRDELSSIQQIWPHFERLVGLRGRRMYAMVDTQEATYSVCTPVKEGDQPGCLGLDVGELPGGGYLRALITGDPPELYERIGPAMETLRSLASPVDTSRPLVEYYRRHDEIELWVPIPDL